MPTYSPEEMQLGRYGAAVISKHLKALQEEFEGVRLAEDIEYIHRMRVASRRTRNALNLFQSIFSKKDYRQFLSQVRRITSALGAARDLDVQIDLLSQIDSEALEKKYHTGLRRLKLRLRQERTRKQEDVFAALDYIDRKATINRIEEALSPYQDGLEETAPSWVVYTLAGTSTLNRLDDFLFFEQFIRSVECVTELHEMRIKAKQLRYTLETFAPLYPENLKMPLQTVRTVQEILGGIHDCDVWVQTLPEFIEAERQRSIDYSGTDQVMKLILPGLRYFQENRASERQALYTRFLKLWNRWSKDKVWEELKKTVRKPMVLAENVFPYPGFTFSVPDMEPEPELLILESDVESEAGVTTIEPDTE